MVYTEDEHLAPFFLKKNGLRGVHPRGRIRRYALIVPLFPASCHRLLA
jgi:hypothetical protein